jgi:hypothetical protein
MTAITVQDGAVVVRDGKVGTEAACCCEPGCSAFCPEPEGDITAKVSFPYWSDCEPVPEWQRELWFDLPDVVLTPAAAPAAGGPFFGSDGTIAAMGWEGFYPIYDYSGCGYGGECPAFVGWDPIYILLLTNCDPDCECNFVIYYPAVSGLHPFPNYGPWWAWASTQPFVPALADTIYTCGETPPSTCMKGLTRPPAGKYESAYYWNAPCYYGLPECDQSIGDCLKRDCLWQVVLE